MAASTRHRNVNKNTKEDCVVKQRPMKNDVASPAIGFSLIIIIRLCSAVWTIIGDCDEVYNYWEPAHFLVYNKGFQTWEYSPVYAIRSYLYVWFYTVPVRITNMILTNNKVVQFFIVRLILAFSCCLCEIYFYRGIKKQFGVNANRLTQWFSLFSAGMFVATPAFLPSSFAMYMTFLSMGAWFQGNNKLAILSTAASTLIGWPFVSVLGIPMALDILIRQRKITSFIIWSFLSFVMCMGPLIIFDSYYYGKLVIAPLNIVLYNVFGENGPELYGVEPVSFYLLNGFLNFNFIFLAALVSLPIIIFNEYIMKFNRSSEIPTSMVLAPMYIWIAIFFTTPHKEERFLFPIYPLIVLAGALCIDNIQIFYHHLRCSKQTSFKYKYQVVSTWIPITIGCIFTVFSACRILALYKGYHASLDVYMELNRISKDIKVHPLSPTKTVNVCVGKEWYRFPSSFFLPNENWHLRFLKSDFGGQLPQPYASKFDATRIIPENMNDKNLEEKSRYIDEKKCHYLIDLDLDVSLKQYSKNWKTIYKLPFLHSNRSHRFFRAFFIPFLSQDYCTWAEYKLLQSKRLFTKYI